MLPKAVVVTAKIQFGLVNDAQLLAGGLTHDGIFRRVKRGVLERVLPGVYRIPGTPDSWEQRLMAAALWGGRKSAICGPSAAALWRLADLPRDGVELAVVGDRRHRNLPFKVHRIRDEVLSDIQVVQNIPVTSVPQTLLCLAGMKHPRTGRALDDALFKRLTSLGEMWLLYEEAWTRRRRGIRILRTLLIDRTPENAPTQTDLEDLLRGIVRNHSLPQPNYQHEIVVGGETLTVDAAYPEAMIVIECDSYAFHSAHHAFERDRERDLKLAMAGWLVLRFTWGMLRFRGAEVAGTIRHHYHERVAA